MDICVDCNEREIELRKMRMCMRCYQVRYRGGQFNPSAQTATKFCTQCNVPVGERSRTLLCPRCYQVAYKTGAIDVLPREAASICECGRTKGAVNAVCWMCERQQAQEREAEISRKCDRCRRQVDLLPHTGLCRRCITKDASNEKLAAQRYLCPCGQRAALSKELCYACAAREQTHKMIALRMRRQRFRLTM